MYVLCVCMYRIIYGDVYIVYTCETSPDRSVRRRTVRNTPSHAGRARETHANQTVFIARYLIKSATSESSRAREFV